LHRHGAAGNRVGVKHASDFWPRHVHRPRDRSCSATRHGWALLSARSERSRKLAHTLSSGMSRVRRKPHGSC
jgi:hypothetical protein